MIGIHPEYFQQVPTLNQTQIDRFFFRNLPQKTRLISGRALGAGNGLTASRGV